MLRATSTTRLTGGDGEKRRHTTKHTELNREKFDCVTGTIHHQGYDFSVVRLTFLTPPREPNAPPLRNVQTESRLQKLNKSDHRKRFTKTDDRAEGPASRRPPVLFSLSLLEKVTGPRRRWTPPAAQSTPTYTELQRPNLEAIQAPATFSGSGAEERCDKLRRY